MKTTIIGTGMVGASFAYRLAVSGLCDEMVLTDVNKDRAIAEAEELNHCTVIEGIEKVIAGDYKDAENSDFIVITAGIGRIKPGQTRLDLIDINAKILKEIVPKVTEKSPDAFIIIATNPLDVMTFTAWKLSNFSTKKVIGSGTLLDTCRLKNNLSKHLKVKTTEIEIYVLGEHGDSQVAIYSQAEVKGLPLVDFCRKNGIPWNDQIKKEIAETTKSAAYQIIQGKGATYYGIATCLYYIVESIVKNKQTILPVCSLVKNKFGIGKGFISVPTIINCNGVDGFVDLPFDNQEQDDLIKSNEIINQYCRKIEQILQLPN